LSFSLGCWVTHTVARKTVTPAANRPKARSVALDVVL
jgi:hypothetical protein